MQPSFLQLAARIPGTPFHPLLLRSQASEGPFGWACAGRDLQDRRSISPLQDSLMALSRVCACARSARVLVLVLLASTLVELCLPQTLPPVTENYSHVTFLKVVDDVEPSPSPIRSTESAENNVSVHDGSGGGSEPEDRRKLGYSFESDAAPWRESTDEGVHRIRMMMMLARRGRSLRTSKPYPCSLPAGKQTESCCGSVCAIVATNPNHCGRCGHICRSDRACCGGKCRRLATDERNCGRCGSRCAVGTKCLFGLCGY